MPAVVIHGPPQVSRIGQLPVGQSMLQLHDEGDTETFHLTKVEIIHSESEGEEEYTKTIVSQHSQQDDWN